MAEFKHWTSESVEAFKYAVASDFIGQLQTRIDENEVRQKDIARALGISEARVSQLFNRPDNLTLRTLVKLVRVLGLKLSIVAYEDAREAGPVHPDIFRQCWEAMGAPKDMFELQERMEKGSK